MQKYYFLLFFADFSLDFYGYLFLIFKMRFQNLYF